VKEAIMPVTPRARHTIIPKHLPVPQVDVPAAHNSLDTIINAFVEAWNQQGNDETGYIFFNTPLTGQRQHLVADSLYRIADEEDRKIIARQLDTLAKAILGGCFRWTSQ
jgi:hypothetical protein